MLPVSLHVLEAGEGGGGISKRSAVSLWFDLLLLLLALAFPLDSRLSKDPPVWRDPAGKILKR